MAPAESAAGVLRGGATGGAPWIRRILGVLGAASLAFYLGWNVFWLAHGRLPPSIFQTATGWPCPTTGCTRSLAALLRGDWLLSLHFNAMTVPILVLLSLSLGWLAVQAVQGYRLRLPRAFFWVWLGVLGLAWVLKLTGGSQYW